MTVALEAIKHFVLDMDGTIYLGGTVFPATLPFLATLDELGIGYTFVTNNCSKDRAAYKSRLESIGINVGKDQIYTSAHATIHYLKSQLATARRLYVIGTAELFQEFKLAGYHCVDDSPDVVVLSFDTQVTYDRLARAAYLVSEGCAYIATHPDPTCPTDEPTILLDCGSFCALLKAATNRSPDAVPGKPNALMLEGVLSTSGLSVDSLAVVGDRLYTDIQMAREAGALAILTLTGETTREDLVGVPAKSLPDMIIAGLDSLTKQLITAHAGAGTSK